MTIEQWNAYLREYSATVRAAVPGWRSGSPARIAPLVLLTDPVLSRMMTPERARIVIETPRSLP